MRFDLARIADALQASLSDVFPQVGVPLRRLRRREPKPTWHDAVSDPKLCQALEQAGLDMGDESLLSSCLRVG